MNAQSTGMNDNMTSKYRDVTFASVIIRVEHREGAWIQERKVESVCDRDKSSNWVPPTVLCQPEYSANTTKISQQ